MITILLSTYNGESYLAEQLESLVQQKGVTIRILIRDDGSYDNTTDIIRHWQSLYPQFIDFIQGTNVGFAMSFTHLLQIAMNKYPEAEYFAFCDQDDVWLPDKLQKAMVQLDAEPVNIPVTYCSNTRLVDNKLRFIRMCWKENEVHLSKERALIQSFATGCTMVFNRKAAETYVSHLPEVIKVHDFLMYQLCMFLGKVIYDKNSYILYRQHGNNQIGQPGAITRWKYRFMGKHKKNVLRERNLYFLKAYKDLLSLENILLISQIAFYRENIFTRLSLIFNRKIRYTRIESNLMFFLKIMIGIV